MPRAIKTKAAGAAGSKKKSKLYNKPEKIKEGTILKDLTKTEWKIGPSIGTGGFGEIYTACKVGQKNYDYVVKCEPHDNGPLFVEMHFYMRNAKLEDIVTFKNNNNLHSLGIPYMLGNGSTEINGIRHRFLILPRFGSDINKYYLANGKRLPEGTVYRIALQMIDAYKFIHDCGYVHADLKAANILLGNGKNDTSPSQAYLVDFGLAAHYTTKAFKPDPKKMHNGTIEYTSRDAHMGVATMRGDMEILSYNIIDWLGVELPWIKSNILAVPKNVQNLKEDFMTNVEKHLRTLFPQGVSTAVLDYIKYVAKMKYNDTPDYAKCRKIFSNALKVLKISNTGDLELKIKNNEKSSLPSTSKAVKSTFTGRSRIKQELSENNDDDNDDDDDVVINASDDDDGDVILVNKKTRDHLNQTSGSKRKSSPKLDTKTPPKKTKLNNSRTPINTVSSGSISKNHLTPVRAKANIKISPSIKMNSNRLRGGNTIINDNITPNLKAGKTYEFNFELDVSVDANVIVNVKRKKKALPKDTQKESILSTSNSNTPVTRVKVRKVGSNRTSDNDDSPQMPTVTVRKSKRLIQSPR